MSFLWYSNVRYKYAMRPYLCQVDSISSRLHCVTRLAESILERARTCPALSRDRYVRR